MGYMIEITDSNINEMSELVEEVLSCGGKLMRCLDGMGDRRSRMGRRSPIPDYRDNWNDDYNDDRYEERCGGRRGGYRY